MLGASTPLLALTALTTLTGVANAALDPIVIKVNTLFTNHYNEKLICHRVLNSSIKQMAPNSSSRASLTKPESPAMAPHPLL